MPTLIYSPKENNEKAINTFCNCDAGANIEIISDIEVCSRCLKGLGKVMAKAVKVVARKKARRGIK